MTSNTLSSSRRQTAREWREDIATTSLSCVLASTLCAGPTFNLNSVLITINIDPGSRVHRLGSVTARSVIRAQLQSFIQILRSRISLMRTRHNSTIPRPAFNKASIQLLDAPVAWIERNAGSRWHLHIGAFEFEDQPLFSLLGRSVDQSGLSDRSRAVVTALSESWVSAQADQPLGIALSTGTDVSIMTCISSVAGNLVVLQSSGEDGKARPTISRLYGYMKDPADARFFAPVLGRRNNRGLSRRVAESRRTALGLTERSVVLDTVDDLMSLASMANPPLAGTFRHFTNDDGVLTAVISAIKAIYSKSQTLREIISIFESETSMGNAQPMTGWTDPRILLLDTKKMFHHMEQSTFRPFKDASGTAVPPALFRAFYAYIPSFFMGGKLDDGYLMGQRFIDDLRRWDEQYYNSYCYRLTNPDIND